LAAAAGRQNRQRTAQKQGHGRRLALAKRRNIPTANICRTFCPLVQRGTPLSVFKRLCSRMCTSAQLGASYLPGYCGPSALTAASADMTLLALPPTTSHRLPLVLHFQPPDHAMPAVAAMPRPVPTQTPSCSSRRGGCPARRRAHDLLVARAGGGKQEGSAGAGRRLEEGRRHRALLRVPELRGPLHLRHALHAQQQHICQVLTRHASTWRRWLEAAMASGEASSSRSSSLAHSWRGRPAGAAGCGQQALQTCTNPAGH
jgi:hypothetical protein